MGAWKTLLIFLALVGLTVSSNSRAEPRLVMIVNQDNPATQISLRDLADFYEKKKRYWPDDTPVRFVDRNPGSPERKTFLRTILKQSESSIDLYWYGQKLHSGDSTPLQVSSDEMVIEFVKSFKGAIGYVSLSTRIAGEPVKVIKVTGAGQE
jgi:ABC-type phosphate transport system substrate-binding protein